MALAGGDARGELVCVTGGSGFVGSWLVRLLLDRGYTVHATVQNLRAARDSGVKRVVMVSSQTAMCPTTADWPAGKVIDDDCWADVEILKKLELWYNVSKTLAEKAAWDFAGEEGLQLVVLNPGLVLGPTLTPAPTGSLRLLMLLLGGQKLDMEPFFVGCVDVRDVAQSLVVLYENPSAQGRHLCMESAVRLVDFHDELANLYPEFPVHRIQEDKQGWVVRSKAPSKKLIDLGVRFTPFDKTVRDTVDCLRSKGEI
ncbi:unnamed protein product [Triticum turgidum subsp. durum]|uniref:NAD(P)-binding domain-containing protein n=1 Tax=Triticum turgidum subsp. durum TaxID=4567 RepID=A0A9R0RW00_TRITD|nr:unnamed protein product [Triticum turgidum subsp. durum]